MSYYATLPYFLQSLDSNGINAMFHRVIGTYLHVCSKNEGGHLEQSSRFDFIESIYEGRFGQWLQLNSVQDEARSHTVIWAINVLQNRLLRRNEHRDLPYVSNTHALAAVTLLMRSIDIGAHEYSLTSDKAIMINEGMGLLKCFPGMAVINDQLSRTCFDPDRIGFACYRLSQSQVDIRISYRGDPCICSADGDYGIDLPGNLTKPSMMLVDLPLIARKIHDSVINSTPENHKFHDSLRTICTDITTTARILEGVATFSNEALINALNGYLLRASAILNGAEAMRCELQQCIA